MLDHKTRKILYFDIFVKKHPEDSPPFDLDESIDLLNDRFTLGLAAMYLKKETAAIRIKELVVDKDNKFAILLINYSDKNISDPVFGDLTTGLLREEPKLEGEGVAVSAHLVISLEKGKSGGHLALLEYVPGLSRGIIQPFLNNQLRQSSTYEFPSDTGKQKKCRPKFFFEALEGQNLKDDLTRGQLKSFELVKYKNTIKDFDQDDQIEPTISTVEFKVKKHLTLEAAMSLIDDIRKKGKKHDYSEIHVRFKDKFGRSRAINIGTNEVDAANILYGKYDILKTRTVIKQCTNLVHEELARQMCRLLAVETHKEIKP